MILHDIDLALQKLYCTYETREGIAVSTGIRYEGDAVNFIFTQEDDKYACLATNRNFSEWVAWSTGNWKKAAPKIEKLAAIHGVCWDNAEGSLFIRFRRNEMTLAEAVLRLQQAAALVGSLESE